MRAEIRRGVRSIKSRGFLGGWGNLRRGGVGVV